MSRRPGAGGPGRDPLGREAGNRGGALEGALHGGADVAERARQVLEELRRRLADPEPAGGRARLFRAAVEARLSLRRRAARAQRTTITEQGPSETRRSAVEPISRSYSAEWPE